MTTIPDTFRAFVAETVDGEHRRGVRDFRAADLMPGEVDIRVDWSSVNFKDALAAIPNGRVARIDPLIPGIDLAGIVVDSRDPSVAVGATILVNGYDLGTSHHGGYAEFARVPAGWIVPLPAGLTTREAMAVGTAGFTAAMAVEALEGRGLRPGDGPVLVTGASGGVGSTAVAMLAGRGYEVWALTGKADEHERLRGLGAVGFLGREDAPLEGKALESARWAGAVDSAGAATLPYVLRTLNRGAAVAACGNASGAALTTTVAPFILRGVALLGMDSVAVPLPDRIALWNRIAGDLRPKTIDDGVREVTLESLTPALGAIAAGEARGRWVVRIGA
jgi:acrylyl-CoA reductase (NADPH)